MTPADLNNGFRTGAVSAFIVGVILLFQSAVFSVQFRKELRRLEEKGMLERAEYAFQNARGDLHGNVRLSDTFIYGRHAALARPLTDVLWVYWHEKTGAVDVHLLTADGRDCMLRLSGQTARRNAEEILQAVAARNSGVLVGRTRENACATTGRCPASGSSAFAGSCSGLYGWRRRPRPLRSWPSPEPSRRRGKYGLMELTSPALSAIIGLYIICDTR